MQQHTGQHILSQAFISLFNAPTRGFRVLEQSCEIDLELSNPTTEIIERAVGLANNVIWENRAITIKEVSSSEARSEEHTSELQSPCKLVCRLLLEKKNNGTTTARR